MALPLAVPLLLSAASTIPQWIAGYQQSKRADELASGLKRPEFDIPESQKKALASAEAQAGMTRLPGQSAIEGRLDQTTANKIAMIERMTTGGPSAINAAGSAYGQQMDAENQLGVQAANMRLNNQSILRDELGRMSQYENMKWAWDKKQPFEDTATAIEALREGGMRNKNAAFKDTLGSAANLATMSWLRGGSDTPDWLSKLLGDGGAGSTPSASVTDSPYYNQDKFTISPYKPTNVFDSPQIKIG